jgi:hypothetical protein
MKKAAEDTCKKALVAGCRLVFLHVPGVQLIAEQIDGGSREGALRLAGPACTRRTRSEISSLLQPHGWVVTFDLFTAQSNVLVERFASWTDEPHSEIVDAFTMRSWNQSTCVCGLEHRETSFIFPPRGLERVVVRRAKSDRVRACFVLWAGARPLWRSRGPGSESASGGPGGAVEGARPGRGPGW